MSDSIIARQMNALELQEDADVPTSPSVPSGMRLRAMRTAEDAVLVTAREISIALDQRNTNATRFMRDKIQIVMQTILSWDIAEPDPGFRDRFMIQWVGILSQALHVLSGGR